MGWSEKFEGLASLPKDIRDELESRSQVMDVPEGTTVFAPGMHADNLLLLLSGTVRVQQVSESGREIVLYRVEAGESCVMTTACLIAHEDYAAEGITETACRAVAIPRKVFDDLAAKSDAFRQFVFSSYARRITDLFGVIEALAFQRVDIRLAQRLLKLAGEADTLETTHQKLATELGTAREVVSRQLREFQRRGWIEQNRGSVTLLDRGALEALSEE
ncbi:Crp/Fnr family transcriptional regulator [Mangrovicoccus sp. HB161399]|uniref:Crp/Fnr family transcriptional regulator n=1 Tax=Mangrovicoccus sp. HB161399 TaxID=2720392 RepID=UPI001555CBC0|nr:Crp/Fnr family transcriptional regulator [Mangrovicoccus sp. HB161399]